MENLASWAYNPKISMHAFISRHFNPLFISFLVLFGGLAFYTGFVYGKKGSGQGNVVLSCTADTLSKLQIPVSTLAEGQKQPLKTASSTTTSLAASATPIQTQGNYVGSKNGTKYYKPSCGTAKRIKPENRVWFNSIEDATLQGYSAGKC